MTQSSSMDNYQVVRDIGSGSFAVTRLLRNTLTNELFAVKFLHRGNAVNEDVAKEIMNHRVLYHPNIIRFYEVAVTSTHLAVRMEYAAGGNLLQRIQKHGRFSEDEARYFFQQLISGISYSHFKQICHRDLKLENILLDGNPAPRLKICDFGFSNSSLLHSGTSTAVGTPTYMAPEVYSRREYDGRMADVWSCGVVLYVMLVGAYPFEDSEDPEDSNDLIKRIFRVQYRIPDSIRVSQGCRHILSRIFVAKPNLRITVREIRNHPWFLKNLPRELTDASQAGLFVREPTDYSLQSVEDIMKIVNEARIPPFVSTTNEIDERKSNDGTEQDDMQGSKRIINKIVKQIFSGNKQDDAVGARATVFVQGKPTKDDSSTSSFSRDRQDTVGARATKLSENEIAEEKSFNSVLSNNTRMMDMLGQRATKVSQCESTTTTMGLARLTVSSSFCEKEDIIGTRATKHTSSRKEHASFTNEFD